MCHYQVFLAPPTTAWVICKFDTKIQLLACVSGITKTDEFEDLAQGNVQTMGLIAPVAHLGGPYIVSWSSRAPNHEESYPCRFFRQPSVYKGQE